MSEPAIRCRWAGSTNPRIVPGRHLDECPSNECRGCQPCTEPHCRICHFQHATGTCAECLAEVRADLREIARLCDALPEEVKHRGINGEAMMLLGPAADPEACGHLEASMLAGRVPADYLEQVEGDTHPTFVLLSWAMVWRDALEHDEAPDSEMETAVDYLDRQMTYMAGFPHVPFEDFGSDLRRCHTHLLGVLADSNRGVRANVPCFDCGADLSRALKPPKPCVRHQTPARAWMRTLSTYPELLPTIREQKAAQASCGDCDQGGFEDHWKCAGCKRQYTIAEFNIALRGSLEVAQA